MTNEPITWPGILAWAKVDEEGDIVKLCLSAESNDAMRADGWIALVHESAIKGLRAKLQRVRDAIVYAANSDGGLVAEIDAAMGASDAGNR